MKLKINMNIFIFVFVICTFLFCCLSNVYGATIKGYVQSDVVSEGSIEIHSKCDWQGNFITDKTSKVTTSDEIADKVKKYVCQEVSKAAKDNFSKTDVIPEIKLTGEFHEGSLSNTVKIQESQKRISTYSLTDLTRCANDWLCLSQDTAFFTITLDLGDTKYTIETTSYKVYKVNDDGEEEVKDKSTLTADKYQYQYRMYQNTLKLLEKIEDAAIEGVVAGSIGAGYNVATPYSTKQRPLTDVIELKGGYQELDENGNETTVITHYDFKSMSDVKYAFSSYYSPLFGEVLAEELPQNEEEWVEYARKYEKDKGRFTNQNNIVISPEYSTFLGTFNASTVNQAGYKEAKDIKIDGGAKKFNLNGSYDPGSVLSYMMQMYSPYIYSLNSGVGELILDNLKPIDNYKLCLYDNNIYSTIDTDENGVMKKITSMAEMNITLDYLYLYYINSEVEETSESGGSNSKKTKKGVVIVGMYEECVVDTSRSAKENTEGLDNITFQSMNNMYLTGRKIGLLNGYSDNLNFNRENSKIMFVRGDSGDEGYLPKNVAFPVDGVVLDGIALNMALNPEITYELPDEYNNVDDFVKEVKDMIKPKTDEEVIDYVFNIKKHGSLPNGCEGVFFMTGFGKFFDENKNKDDENNSGDNGGSKYSFYIIRNNKYVQDESLINWLKSDSAASLSYVKRETLLAKILGDFTPELEKLTYMDWLEIQKIKRNLQHDKDMWLVRVINVTSLVFGVFLIIFAILFMMAYWIDVFNTFTDFSILQFVSFGNLYPITDDSTLPYLIETKGETKFVKFKDVLILAVIMMALGILFMNTDKVIGLIVNIYNYIMYVFGGV